MKQFGAVQRYFALGQNQKLLLMRGFQHVFCLFVWTRQHWNFKMSLHSPSGSYHRIKNVDIGQFWEKGRKSIQVTIFDNLQLQIVGVWQPGVERIDGRKITLFVCKKKEIWVQSKRLCWCPSLGSPLKLLTEFSLEISLLYFFLLNCSKNI